MIRLSSSLMLAVLVLLLVSTGQGTVLAQRQKAAANPDDAPSEMRPIIEYYAVDRGSLLRSYPVAASPARRARFRKFYGDALLRIQQLDFDRMSEEGKVDYILFRNHLEHELRQLDIEERQSAEMQPLMPFASVIVDLEEARRRMEKIDSAKTAATLTDLKKQVEDARRAVEAGLRSDRSGETRVDNVTPIHVKKTVAFRSIAALNNLRNNLRNWYSFYNGYDPVFSWWNEQPYKSLDESLAAYISFLSDRVLGLRTETTSTVAATRGPGGGPGQSDFSADETTLRNVIPRLGLADVRNFGLSWDDCEQLLKELGYSARVEIVAA